MRKPVFLYPDDDLKKISSKLRRSDVDVFVVINKKGKFLGEIHEIDLLAAVIPENKLGSEEVIGIMGFGIKKKFFGKKAKDFMKKHNFTANLNDNVEDIAVKMYREEIRCIPVIVKDKVRGVITIGELVRHLA
jgi:CBS domain-containing protein